MHASQDKKQSKSFFSKVSIFFKSLCTPGPPPKSQITPTKPKPKKKVRLTFLIDRAIIKLSRRNIYQQEFMASKILSVNLQKYIVTRMASCSTIILKGEFTEASINLVSFPILINTSKPKPTMFRAKNQFYVNYVNSIKFRSNTIDGIAIQLYFGQKAQKAQKVQKAQQKHKQQRQVDVIEEVLKFYKGSINNYVFVCSRDTKMEDFHELFVLFKDYYMFEMEKIMQTDKVHCVLIHISNSPAFLRIDDYSLIDYLIDQIIKIDPKADSIKMSFIFEALFNAKLHLQVCNTLGQLLISNQIQGKSFQIFLKMLQKRYQNARGVLKQCNMQLQDERGSYLQDHRHTPLFREGASGQYMHFHSFALNKEDLQEQD